MMDRRQFLHGLIMVMPSAKLVSSVAGAWGSPPSGVRLGWDELQSFFPEFAARQKRIIADYGLSLLEDGPLEEDNYFKLFEWGPYDPTDGLSIMDAYVRAVHGEMVKYPGHDRGGIEGWFAGNTDWCIFPKPFEVPIASGSSTIHTIHAPRKWFPSQTFNGSSEPMTWKVWTPDGGIEGTIRIRGIHSWNEPGEPGGSNPGPMFTYLLDQGWVAEDEMLFPFYSPERGPYDRMMEVAEKII